MAHAASLNVNVEELIQAKPLRLSAGLNTLFKLFTAIGIVTFGLGLVYLPHQYFWQVYHVNLIYFMGLAAGGVALTAIFQVVRATWTGPIRRIAEANVAFLPFAFLLWAVTYFGAKDLFPWASQPYPGREGWMTHNFVYARFFVLLGLLFFLMRRFVRMSLRSDIGLLREKCTDKERWRGSEYQALTEGWKGSAEETIALQRKMSWNAPAVIIAYGVIFSLFSFDMVMSTDPMWYANMYGGFTFIGNIYLAWAMIGITAASLLRSHPGFAKVIGGQQFWDMGKLTFAFCMLWGYMFFAQFLPQWYGNMPEETQWLIMRTREYPWKALGWLVFPMCFVIPFITLLSRDLKKTPHYFARICVLIALGIWGEKYLTLVPQSHPDSIPFGFFEIGLFLGFLGMYALAVRSFLQRYPYIPLSHPQLKGHVDW